MKKKTSVLIALVMVVIILSSCAASFPKKEIIAALSGEKAADALKDRTKKEINDNWGKPDGILSGFYGDIYEYNSKQIVIYYDGDSSVTDVLVFDN